MDESNATCGKRLDSIGMENTEANRLAYRELLVTTPNLGDFISGAILFEETLYQTTSTGKTIVQCLNDQNIVPGIKTDKGLVPLVNSNGESWCQGLDGLAQRSADYYKQVRGERCLFFRRNRSLLFFFLRSSSIPRHVPLLFLSSGSAPSRRLEAGFIIAESGNELRWGKWSGNSLERKNSPRRKTKNLHPLQIKQGARFCKWRTTVTVGAGPTNIAVQDAAYGLARYGAISQGELLF